MRPFKSVLPLKIVVPLVLGIAVSLAIAIYAELGYRRLESANREMAVALEMQATLNETLALIVDAETGQRGYLLTGRDEYLAPYNAALPKIDGAFTRLRELLVANGTAAQRTTAGRINNLVGKKLAELEAAIALYRTNGAEAAQALLSTGIGRRTMEEIRAEVDAMGGTHRAQLAEATTRWANDVGFARAGMQIMTAFTVVLLLVVWLLARRDVQQRDARRLSLNTLLGDLSDGSTVATEANTPLDDTMIAPVAPGLPSDLLTRRPDVLAAEHRLQGANANIGAARAAFFPQISLTAFGGTASTELKRLFRGANRVWGFSPSLSLPIFDAGRKRANLALAEVRKNLAVVQYEQTVQNAFREVADALSAQHWALRQVEVHQRALGIERERARLSRLSYDHGASSFLEVLDAERNLISAEQQLVQTRRALLSSRVALYAALGGGSHDVDETPPGPTSASPANFTRR